MRIILVGFGDTTHELAAGLADTNNHELIIIDIDEARCDLASKLDALVLQGDGTDPDVLKQARCADADAVVAATGGDALNTVIAMLAKGFGVPKLIVRLNGRGLRAACEEIGVSAIVAPRLIAAAEMRNALLEIGETDLSVLEKGDIRLAELAVGGAAGSSVKDLELPDDVLLLGVLRSEEVIFPHGNVRLEEGDSVMLLVENESALKSARSALKPNDHQG